MLNIELEKQAFALWLNSIQLSKAVWYSALNVRIKKKIIYTNSSNVYGSKVKLWQKLYAMKPYLSGWIASQVKRLDY